MCRWAMPIAIVWRPFGAWFWMLSDVLLRKMKAGLVRASFVHLRLSQALRCTCEIHLRQRRIALIKGT
jgi:hypothetical protein